MSFFTQVHATPFWTITAENISLNSVTLKASNLTPSGSYIFSVANDNNNQYSYNNSENEIRMTIIYDILLGLSSYLITMPLYYVIIFLIHKYYGSRNKRPNS